MIRYIAVDYESIALTVVRVMKIPELWVISIDRTDWQFGKTVFNILMLGVVYKGVAFPLIWSMLDKKGNSNMQERRDLWNRFLEIFGSHQIDFLTADREFVGEDWFDYLLYDPMTRFRIRVKKNTLLDDGQKQLRASVCFQHLQIGESIVLSKQRKIWGNYFYVAALRLADGELLIVASSNTAETAIADYAKRWGIETLFGCFKSRGFCLESTHLQDSARLSKLIALLALALCWAFSSGLWLLHENPLKL